MDNSTQCVLYQDVITSQPLAIKA